MRRNCVFVFLFSAGISCAADPHWIRAQSPNFEIYSTAGETAVRNTLVEFEELRAFFQTMRSTEDRSVPVRIVAFNSPKEYDPYRPTEASIAFYHAGLERDAIVMNHISYDTFPVAIHEYVHLEVNHWGLTFPAWFNEGIAEVFSTLRPSAGGTTLVGDLIPGRAQGLINGKWVPLAVVLAVDSRSPYYGEKNKSNSFYNEAWGLTHMLYLSQEYRPKFPDVMSALAAGKDSAEALTSIYGKPLAVIEEDLQLYIRGSRFRAALFPARLKASNIATKVEPAPSFDLHLTLFEISRRKVRDPVENAAMRQELSAMAAEQPERPEPHALLGYVIWRAAEAGKPLSPLVRTDVEKEFAAAFALGDRSPTLLWDYGRLIEPAHPMDAAEVFQRLLTVEPGRREAIIELASAILLERQPEAALKVMDTLPGTITSAQAPRYYMVSASIYARLGQPENARVFATKLLNAPKSTASDKQWAQQFLDRLK
jgi:hypothetical protein